MAYDANTDYKAKETELKKQLAAATDPATKSAIVGGDYVYVCV